MVRNYWGRVSLIATRVSLHKYNYFIEDNSCTYDYCLIFNGVRHGVSMAPHLFFIYVNGLNFY